jgi:CIC family chloride channel protein
MRKPWKILKQHFMELDLRYLRRWLLVGGLIGIVAGLGSIVFSWAISEATRLFLGQGAGFIPPVSFGEGPTIVTAISRRWMIPVITTVGGILSGFIVYKFAPEAEGHGTDAAIDAFHNKEGSIRARIPLVKLVASAITIGSGGSAGREGPTAQIAAGFGSLLGRFLKLTVQERRIAVAAGIGAGIGAIFKAPLGGAILSTEILYLEGFEVGALIPAFIASIIGYTIYSAWAGFTPVFGGHLDVTFNDPYQLLYYAGLGILCGLVGSLYPRVFYAVRDLFKKLPVSNYVKPAIGGLIVGLMGLFLPQVLGMGYGWLQIAMTPQTMLGIGLMVILVFAKIAATSFSIGSGGSGGVFAPGLFIGGLIGAIVWTGFHTTLPHMPVTPEPFVVVGMMALFGGVARAPLAVMFMVGEMAGSYSMLAPAMIAVSIAYILIGKHTIYESQVASPAVSPAHMFEFSFPLLRRLTVKDAMNPIVKTVPQETTAQQALDMLTDLHIKSLPVTSNGHVRLAGIVTARDVLRTPRDVRGITAVADIMTREVVSIRPHESLDTAMELMTQHDIASLPVIDGESGAGLVGIVTRADISRAYTQTARKMIKTRGAVPRVEPAAWTDTTTPAEPIGQG